MKNRFDYISKRIGKDALGTSGTIVADDAITTETQYADLRHEPDPARHAERARLGLLGRLAATPCLIEVYSKAPRPDDVRSCLLCRVRHNRHYADRRIMPRRRGRPTRGPTSTRHNQTLPRTCGGVAWGKTPSSARIAYRRSERRNAGGGSGHDRCDGRPARLLDGADYAASSTAILVENTGLRGIIRHSA